MRDKYGVSWQIIPSILGKLLGDKDPKKAKRVMDAMLQMDKIDIKRLEQAAVAYLAQNPLAAIYRPI